METLTLGGKEYIKASKAAKNLGYAADYVSQLCRSGKVDAHLVGRTWYVNLDTLGAHRIEKKRNARVKAREYAHASIQEAHIRAATQNKNSSRNIAIRYIPDHAQVLPEVKKVHVVHEKFIDHGESHEENTALSKYEVVNKDKKILMSGKIPVFDVDAETPVTDTVILRAKIQKSRLKEYNDGATNHDGLPEVSIQGTPEEAEQIVPSTFTEKLQASNVAIAIENDEEVATALHADFNNDSAFGGTTPVFYRLLILASICTVLLSVCTLFLESKSLYTSGEVDSTVGFTLDIIRLFYSKI
jgi:hypothetical protein